MLSKNRVIQLLVETLPTMAAKAVPFVPAALSKFTLEQTLNRFFQYERQQGLLDFMLQRSLQVTVTDLAFNFYILGQQRQGRTYLHVSHTPMTADVALAGSSQDLYLLITQYIDPDTLFFRRRLTLRGNTELGLEIKNLLDTIELSTRVPKQVYQWSLDVANVVNNRQPLS